MTTFDLLMIPVWFSLAGCIGIWIWIMTDWVRFRIQDRRDRRDTELMATWVMKPVDPPQGLDTQLRNFRNIRKMRDYRSLQDLIVTETKDYPPKGQ